MLSAIVLALTLAVEPTSFIRVNQVGYLPDAPKVAVIYSLDSATFATFKILDARGSVAFGPVKAVASGWHGDSVRGTRTKALAVQAAALT